MEKCDVLIIGAGPSGSLCATKLLNSGYSVVILEKLDFPRFVIGESLLPRCNEILEENNLLDEIKKENYMLKGGAIFINEEANEEYVDFENNLGEIHNSSFQVKREEFDNVLLNCSKKLGADVRHGYEVIEYEQEENIITAKSKTFGEKKFKSKFVLDASGYGRVLPNLLNLNIASDLKQRNAIFTRVEGEIRRENKDEGFIDIVIHDNNKAWLWVIPFNDKTTSVGVVCEDEYFKSTKLTKEEFLDNVLKEHKYLNKKFKNAKRLVPVGIINGYSLGIKTIYGEGFALSGNATEFIDPIFSSGVTLALESANKVSSLIIKQLQGEKVNWQIEYEDYMMSGINIFREFVYAWYDGRLRKIFYSKNKPDKIKKSISSILSGYVWDKNNYFATNTKDRINTLISMI